LTGFKGLDRSPSFMASMSVAGELGSVAKLTSTPYNAMGKRKKKHY